MKFKDYYRVRDWLEEFIPQVYDKNQLGLARIENLLAKLGNPERKFKSIHVAGTSGKGTTAWYTAKLLERSLKLETKRNVILGNEVTPESALFVDSGQSQNDKKSVKIGLHVSPHLVDIRERMQIISSSVIPAKAGIQKRKILDRVENDNPLMPMGRFLKLFGEIRPIVEQIQKERLGLTPSYFEILVAASFLYFAQEKADWVVVEVGLGGRLDATNVLMPEVSVITNIGLDHTEILGNTIEEIAWEKAGIIKSIKYHVSSIKGSKSSQVGVPVVTGASGKALEVIEKVAKEKGSKVYTVGTQGLQIETNKALAMKTIEILGLVLPVIPAKAGIQKKAENWIPDPLQGKQVGDDNLGGLPGRMEEIEGNVVLDGAHNPDKIRYLIEFLRHSPFAIRHSQKKTNSQRPKAKDIVLVLAFKKGKDWKVMVDLLVSSIQYSVSSIFATRYQSVTDTGKGSGVDPKEIAEYVKGRYKGTKGQSIKVYKVTNSQEAVFESLNAKRYSTNSLVLVTGSLYLVGEARTLWKLPGF